MPSRANLFVYSNAATLLSSGLSNTGLENVIYCSTTTDVGPIQNITATSLSSGIPYYMKDAGPRSAVGRHPTRKSEVPGFIPGLATYFRFSFRCFKRGSCQLLAKVCARSTG